MIFGILLLLVSLIIFIAIGSLPSYFLLNHQHKKRFPSLMRNEIEDWLSKGLISQEIYQNLVLNYPIPTRKKSSITLLQIVYIVGSILIGIGAILFIASNWEKLAGWFKLGLVAILSFITLFLGDFFKRKQKGKLVLLGDGLLLLSSILWGVVIIFVFQSYHMAISYNWLLLFIWMVSILPVALWMKAEPVFYLLILLSFIWGIFCRDWLAESYWAFFLVSVGLFLLSKRNRVKEIIISVFQIVFGFTVLEFTLQGITFWILTGLFYIGMSVWRKRLVDLLVSLAPILLAGIFTMIFFFSDNPVIHQWSWVHWLISIGALVLSGYKVFLHKTQVGLLIWLLSVYTALWSFFASKSNFGEVYVAYVAAIVFLFMSVVFLVQKKSVFFPVWLSMGHFLVWIPFFLLSSKEMQEPLLQNPSGWIQLDPSGSIRIIFIILVILGLLVSVLYHAKYRSKKFQFVYLSSFAVCLCFALMSLLIFRDYRLFIINFALLFTIIQSFFWSYDEDQPILFYLGMVALLVFIVLRYFDLLWSLLDRSVFFVTGGILLVLVAVVLERQKRKLDKAEEKYENS